jgi:hypothetical protein
MDSLADILKKKTTDTTSGVLNKPPREIFRKRNILFEQAEEFSAYTGLKVGFVLRACKIYGAGYVFGLRSWIADLPNKQKSLNGLVIWKLKHDKMERDAIAISKTTKEREEKTEAITENSDQTLTFTENKRSE